MRNKRHRLLRAVLWSWVLIIGTLGSAQALEVVDVKKGLGARAQLGKIVRFQYTGRLPNGSVFDSSRHSGKPLQLVLGKGLVIPGLEQGLLGMRVGGKRKLTIPPDLAFGAKGLGNIVPPNATLSYSLNLLEVSDAKFRNASPGQLTELKARGAIIVDIRTPDEWRETGIIEGSKTIMAFDRSGQLSSSFLGKFTSAVEQNQPVVLVCHSGSRTTAIARSLVKDVGYSKLYQLRGGLLKWKASKRKLVPYTR